MKNNNENQIDHSIDMNTSIDEKIKAKFDDLIKFLKENTSYSFCMRVDAGKKALEYNFSHDVFITPKQLILNFISQIPSDDVKTFEMAGKIFEDVLKKQEPKKEESRIIRV